MMCEVSLIIVNYNTGELLYRCLESIRASLEVDYEVWVADNASTDGSMCRCSAFWKDGRFHRLDLTENLGFARANNRAAERAGGRLFHFLNPDTEVTAALNADYRQALAAPDTVYVNPLVNRDGSLENNPMPLPFLRDLFWWEVCPKRARYWYKGASVLVSRENFRQIGGWCEAYFLYAEDLDLFYEIWRHGLSVQMLSARIFHLGGGSSTRAWSSLEREIRVQRSNRLFYRRHSARFEYVAVKLYFLLLEICKRPKRVPFYLKAWVRSRKNR